MIVNVALIVAGQALAQLAHDAGRLALRVDWTPQCAAFRVFGEHDKLFEAQVDGHLSQQTNTGPSEPQMCAEVKADIRFEAAGMHFQEAIWNLREEALAGGGFYSPEGFPFSNM
jgi:hypothetical protein